MRLLHRFASTRLKRENARLRAELEAERLKVQVVEAERDTLCEVLARDRARIQAETAAYQRSRAESEERPRTDDDEKLPAYPSVA